MSNKLIEESRSIWREFHGSFGITLRESKDDWLELLREDPEMTNPFNWGPDFCGETPEVIAEFKEWMESEDE